MKRLFWAGLGVTVGAILTHKTTRALEQFTPTGVGDRLAGSLDDLGGAIRQFGLDVREAMWDREDALREALGLSEDPEAAPEARATVR